MNQFLGGKKRVLSLFSGCGGMDLGFEGGFSVPKRSVKDQSWVSDENDGFVTLKETSFQTVFANDIRPGAKAAWLSYLGTRTHLTGVDSAYHLESIVELVKREWAGESVFPRAVDIVTGGFPCQDFSVAGKRNGLKSHKSHSGKLLDTHEDATVENRGMLYYWMKEVISIVQPKIFIAENVKGLVSHSNVREIIEKDFSEIGDGYLIWPVKVLNAAQFGVPQNRERVLFIGFNKSVINPEISDLITQEDSSICPYPAQTHKLPRETGSILRPHVTVREALDGLAEPEISQDLSQQSYSRAKWYGRHCQGQTEVDLGGVSPTIRSEHHGNIEFRRLGANHGGRNADELNNGLLERRLTVRECARIQTFPDDYHFVLPDNSGKKRFIVSGSEAYKLIGNAVPPLLAYHVAKRLESIWDIIFSNYNHDYTEQPLVVSRRVRSLK